MELGSERLRFREMADRDLDAMANLLGDPHVMRFYPRPKTREEARRWIEWNQANYRDLGFGLWILETLNGEFVGDCGLTLQQVEGEREVEVGYHIRAGLQNQGFATEAALVAKAVAIDRGVERLIAIINPRNVPSQRVAEKIGLRYERTAPHPDGNQQIYAAELTNSHPRSQDASG
jgi:RimJ/RimL family protein N-acetyltransferase